MSASMRTGLVVAALLGAFLALGGPGSQADVDCDEVSQQEAQTILDTDRSDPNRLDRDDDGTACESGDDSAVGGGLGDGDEVVSFLGGGSTEGDDDSPAVSGGDSDGDDDAPPTGRGNSAEDDDDFSPGSGGDDVGGDDVEGDGAGVPVGGVDTGLGGTSSGTDARAVALAVLGGLLVLGGGTVLARRWRRGTSE